MAGERAPGRVARPLGGVSAETRHGLGGVMVSAAWLARAAATGAGNGPGRAIGRHTARQLARRELSKAVYHRGTPLPQRILGAIGRWLARLFDGASGAVPGGWWALVGLAALAVIVVAAVAAWIGPVSARHRRPADRLLPGTAVTARDLRKRAERLAAAGDYAGAVIESARAIAAELDERGALPPRAGRTADELAAEAALELPAEAAELASAARLFDDVRYGDRAGTAAGYRRIRDLDDRIQAARPGAARPGAAGQRGRRTDVMAPAAPRAGQPRATHPPAGQILPGAGTAGPAAATRSVASAGAAPQGPARPGSPSAGRPPAPGQAGAAGAWQAGVAGAWQRWRVPIALVAVILLGGTVIALLRPAAPAGYLDPGNARPGGARALADILASRGHVIVRATTPAAAISAVRAGEATLLVTSPGRLTGGQLASLARAQADIVLVAPDTAALAALAPAVTVGGHALVLARRPACGLPAARLAGPASMGGVLLRATAAGAAACYPAGGLPSLVHYQAGRRAITVLGTGAPLANGGLAAQGNSALALNLLSARPRIVWLVPAARPGAAAAGGQQPLTSLIPLPADLVASQLAIAALMAALWRARRLGPLVPEPLPIVIRASETTEGHARLYQARRARGQAAAALRAAAVRRIAPGIGLTPSGAPAAIVAALAERTGTGTAHIEALLFGADPADDAALVALASDLDVLEREVRAR